MDSSEPLLALNADTIFLGAVLVPSLRAVRVSRALSQDDLAERAGVDRKTVIRAEQGKDVRFVSVRRLARALGVSPQRLQQPAAR